MACCGDRTGDGGPRGVVGRIHRTGLSSKICRSWAGTVGIGWRAQTKLCDYLFTHTPVERIEARTHPENVAEQRSLEKAGFRREGVMRAVEFRDGQWRDGWLYSRLRSDPAPAHVSAGGAAKTR